MSTDKSAPATDVIAALRDTIVEARRKAPTHGVQEWDWLLGELQNHLASLTDATRAAWAERDAAAENLTRATELIGQLRAQLTTAQSAQAALREALTSLGRPYGFTLCFCGVATGNPMYPEHSRVCVNARAALASPTPKDDTR